MSCVIAFDIGGTFVKYGLINQYLEVIEKYQSPTPKTLKSMLDLIRKYTRSHPEVEGIAVSSPGAVSQSGLIYGSSAINYLHTSNIKTYIEQATGLEVFLENDAVCAAYAELGTSELETDNFVMIVIGTGIGGAIIQNGKVFKGANLHAGEFGYMLLNQSPSENLTRMHSMASLVRKVEEMKGLPPSTLSGESVFDMASRDDLIAKQVLSEFYERLAVGIFNLQYICDPNIFIIGGGISARKELISHIEKEIQIILKKYPKATIKPQIKVAKYKQDANLIGAVLGFRKGKEIQ